MGAVARRALEVVVARAHDVEEQRHDVAHVGRQHGHGRLRQFGEGVEELDEHGVVALLRRGPRDDDHRRHEVSEKHRVVVGGQRRHEGAAGAQGHDGHGALLVAERRLEFAHLLEELRD